MCLTLTQCHFILASPLPSFHMRLCNVSYSISFYSSTLVEHSQHMHMSFLHYGHHVLLNLVFGLITHSSHMKPHYLWWSLNYQNQIRASNGGDTYNCGSACSRPEMVEKKAWSWLYKSFCGMIDL